VIVTAIKTREPFIHYLQRHIPDLEVVWDKTQNAMETFLRATEIAGEDPVIRLEEDICLTQNWREKVEAEIANNPNTLINFFSRSKYDAGMGSHWRAGSRFNYNLCVYYPAGFAKAVLEHYKVWPDKQKHPTGTDLLVANYMHQNRMKYWQVVPALVNHAITVSQIDSRRPRKRQSDTFVNPELEGYPA
jgi:hypothetical protein